MAHKNHDDESYGERFEGATIVAMALLIVLAFIGVIALQKATHHDCLTRDYTYCG